MTPGCAEGEGQVLHLCATPAPRNVVATSAVLFALPAWLGNQLRSTPDPALPQVLAGRLPTHG